MSRRAVPLDAWLYGVSAATSVTVAQFASIPIQREWGRIAAVPYAVGAVAALVMAGRRSGDAGSSGPSVRARSLLAALVLVGAAIAPLTLEAVWRSHTAPGLHALSEAIVTEEAARALVRGRNPYAADYSSGPLAARPVGTRTHVPYLPAMFVFGLPRAAGGASPWTDARVAFAGTALALAFVALLRRGERGARAVPGDRRLTTFQVLAVLPTGALLMATGGDDVPVLALMLVALMLARSDRPVWAGLVSGLAAAMKLTAWPLIPFLAMSLRDAGHPGRPSRFLAAAGAVIGTITLPFLVWDPSAFVEDVIKFPLGLGRDPSAAQTPTLGSALVRTLPGERGLVTVGLIVLGLAFAAFLMIRRPPRTVADAAANTGLLILAAFLLAPAARLGYLVYPANLLTWAWLLGDPRRAGAGIRNIWRTVRSRPADGPAERTSPA